MFGAHLIHYDGAGGLATIIMAFVAGMQWRKEGWGDHNPVMKTFKRMWIILEPVIFALIGTEIQVTVAQELDGVYKRSSVSLVDIMYKKSKYSLGIICSFDFGSVKGSEEVYLSNYNPGGQNKPGHTWPLHRCPAGGTHLPHGRNLLCCLWRGAQCPGKNLHGVRLAAQGNSPGSAGPCLPGHGLEIG